MPYATKAQIERARQPDLLTFLRRYKPDELIPTGPGAYKLRSHDSLKISNGKWCWWSHDKMGGVNALEYLIKVENMKFPDAVQLVNEQCGFFDAREVQSAPVKQKETPKAEFLLPVRFQNNRRVTAYLLSRGIDMAVLDYCFQHGLLYEAADYHNAVFVGYDDKTPRYATLRGTLSGSSFKRDVTGSNKRFCFSIDGQNDSKLNVFECAIDALSYLTQVKMQGADWRQESVLSLGGVYQSRPNETPKVPTALQGYLERYAGVQEIVLRLDNDAVGRGAASAISQAITNLPVTVELPAEGKDYNEWLLRQKGISPRQRARNEPER